MPALQRASENGAMPADSQVPVPPSFIALFVQAGRSKPSAPRQLIEERYEFCEDLATLLVDHARDKLWDLKVGEEEVLARVHAGLLADQAGLDVAQAQWVSTRLAELLGWPCTSFAPFAPVEPVEPVERLVRFTRVNGG